MSAADHVNTHLMQSLKFTVVDLEHNRRGELSSAQQAVQNSVDDVMHYMAENYQRKEPQMMLLFVVIMGLTILPIYVFGREPITGVLNRLGIPVAPVVAGIVVLLVLMFFYARSSYRQSLQSMREIGAKAKTVHNVRVATGKVKMIYVPTSRSSSRRFHHYALIDDPKGKKELRISERAMGAFDEDLIYRVYYLDDSNSLSLLSAEVVN